jgi:hypothetical protein
MTLASQPRRAAFLDTLHLVMVRKLLILSNGT